MDRGKDPVLYFPRIRIERLALKVGTLAALLWHLPGRTWLQRGSSFVKHCLKTPRVLHPETQAPFSVKLRTQGFFQGPLYIKNYFASLKQPFPGILFKAINMGPKKATKATKANAKKKAEPAEKAEKAAKASKTKKNEKPAASNETEETKPKKSPQKRKADSPAEEEPKPKLKARVSISDTVKATDFTSVAKSPSGKASNFKIASWNINGIRAWLDKDGTSYIKAEKPDVLCVQELKCDISKIPAETAVDGYTTHWLSGDTEGYSGVGMYFKTKPINITEGLGIPKHDDEGRVITAEFEKFFLVTTYIPNSGRKLVRLNYRTQEWDIAFRDYLKSLDQKKPVIWCGDLNVAHQEIDIKNPKTNKRNAGFTQEERDSFSATLEEGFIDSFRELHPEEEGAYTFWTYMMNARAKNVGWRLDYFVVSKRFKEHICDSLMRSKVMGSDHCPIVLELAL